MDDKSREVLVPDAVIVTHHSDWPQVRVFKVEEVEWETVDVADGACPTCLGVHRGEYCPVAGDPQGF